MVKKAAVVKNIVPVKCYLRTITAEMSLVIGRAMLNFQVGIFRGSQEVWISDTADPCILGLDFMLTDNRQVDLAGATSKIRTLTVPLLETLSKLRYRDDDDIPGGKMTGFLLS